MNPWKFTKAAVTTLFVCLVIPGILSMVLWLLYGYESLGIHATAMLLAFLLAVTRGFHAATGNPAIGALSLGIMVLWLGEMLNWGAIHVYMKGAVLVLNVAPLFYFLMLSALLSYGVRLVALSHGKRLSTIPA